ncbi:hydrogenase [Desulfuromonas versatilis]|uniref:Hydrogenase n=1 Tax=Desulfuromonas versatilis TaxID=2802975 RepID=A0ABM8HNV5_9BACT|nr:DmsC/YnfH family molybdoenzyme membrane anchor subunit [Desulfuromonas versatilis]BCR03170.1 hydrogenase [Desulfuromonas versatilis]
MSHMELPLVFFTVLAQAAIGLAMLSALRGRAVAEGTGGKFFTEQQMALGLLGVGLLASMFHLGHPLGALRTLANLQHSWLSREILVFMVLAALMTVAAGLSFRGRGHAGLGRLTAAVGLVALAIQGFAYAPPSQPTLANGVPLVLFLITALALGAAFGSWFAPDNRQPLLAGVLAATLLLALALNLLLPSVWLSGGLVEELTGSAYLGSPLYWGRLIVGLVLPLLVLARTRRIPGWLPWLILLGEFAGRMAFFSLAATTAANIGMPL